MIVGTQRRNTFLLFLRYVRVSDQWRLTEQGHGRLADLARLLKLGRVVGAWRELRPYLGHETLLFRFETGGTNGAWFHRFKVNHIVVAR